MEADLITHYLKNHARGNVGLPCGICWDDHCNSLSAIQRHYMKDCKDEEFIQQRCKNCQAVALPDIKKHYIGMWCGDATQARAMCEEPNSVATQEVSKFQAIKIPLFTINIV